MKREVYVYSVTAERKNFNRPQIFFRKKFEVEESSKPPKVGTKINFGYLGRVSEVFRSRQGEVTNGKVTEGSGQKVWLEFKETEMSTDELRYHLTEEDCWEELSLSLG